MMSLFSAMGKMALALLAMIGVGVASCEVNKAYWDRQVRELCELDGGVVVYKKVELPNVLGGEDEGETLEIPFRWESSDSPYFMASREREILNSFPLVWRDQVDIVRRADNSLVATKISYIRKGGDFPTGFITTSHFSCSEIESVNLDLFGSTFSRK
jgi:hypothetical protein